MKLKIFILKQYVQVCDLKINYFIVQCMHVFCFYFNLQEQERRIKMNFHWMLDRIVILVRITKVQEMKSIMSGKRQTLL